MDVTTQIAFLSTYVLFAPLVVLGNQMGVGLGC